MNENDLHWFAGLYEGEGTIAATKVSLVLIITMADEDVIRSIPDRIGFGKARGPYGRPNRPNRKPLYTWSVSKREDVLYLIEQLRPLLGQRRRQQLIDAIGKTQPIDRPYGYGVYPAKTKGKWVAKGMHNRRNYHLGTFDSLEAATTARKRWEQELPVDHKD